MTGALRYRTILFDLDGTLIDSIELILASHRHATREVLGESPPDEVLRRGIGTPLWVQMRTIDAPRADELVTAYRAFNHRMHDELLRPYEGLLELCESLRADGAVLGVVTSKSLLVTEMAFARLAFAPLLDVVVTADQTELHKPHPEPILEALRRLGRDASGRLLRGRLALRPAGRPRGRRRPDRRDLGRLDRGRAARRASRRAGSHARRARRGAAWRDA